MEFFAEIKKDLEAPSVPLQKGVGTAQADQEGICVLRAAFAIQLQKSQAEPFRLDPVATLLGPPSGGS